MPRAPFNDIDFIGKIQIELNFDKDKNCQNLIQELSKNLEDQRKNQPIDKYLKDMLGEEVMLTLDTTSQYQIALQHYHRAKQVHSNGSAYETQIRNFIYLEDDFNDNLYHFGVALERQYINSYYLRNRIKEMELELNNCHYTVTIALRIMIRFSRRMLVI